MNDQEKIELQQTIDQYIKGELSQDEIDELWIEFLKQPEWYDWFETQVHLSSLIKKGKRPSFTKGENPSDATQSSIDYKVWFYAAAAAVILAISLQFFTFEQQQPIPSLALTEIEQSNLIGADVLRSTDTPAENLDVAINDALATAYNGETEEAIEQFQELLNESPNNTQQVRIEMNLGILFYNSGNFESAKNHFQSITEMDGIEDYEEEKSWWFLGNVLLNLNHPRQAREAVFNAYSMDGQYQSEALALLKKLDRRLGNIQPENTPEKLGD